MSGGIVLSLFPGIGLLDMAFEEEGFCVVRGPDLLWGGDIHRFHPPAGVFDGVIGGPPCQAFSPLSNVNRARYGDESIAADLIPEFVRCVTAARPAWFLMENVTNASHPVIAEYADWPFLLNNRWLGEKQNRLRRFNFGVRVDLVQFDPHQHPIHPHLKIVALEHPDWQPAVCATSGGRRAVAVKDANGRMRGKQGKDARARLGERSVPDMAELQGLPRDFLSETPFTQRGKAVMIGNGVPLAMGRAVAKAVKKAIG